MNVQRRADSSELSDLSDLLAVSHDKAICPLEQASAMG
jgi:hypothetical protein